MAVTFASGATSIEIRAPELGNRWTTTKYQARGRTADGEPIVEDKGVEVARLSLSFADLDDDDRTALEDFFGAAKVDGSVHTFRFADHNGATHNVRLMSDGLDWDEYDDGYYRLDLELEEVTESDEAA